jgi:hypothetical protein
MPKGKAINLCPGSYKRVQIVDMSSIDDETGSLMIPCPVCERGLKPRTTHSEGPIDALRFFGIIPRHNVNRYHPVSQEAKR